MQKKLIFRDSLTASMFRKIFPAQLAGFLITNINGIIDSLITSNVLGPGPMAAVGLFAPLQNFINMFYFFAVGALVRCSEHAGHGEPEKASNLFSTSFLFLLGFGISLGAVFITFGEQIALFSEVDPETIALLADYIRSYGIGMAGIFIFNLFISFLQLNNMMRWSYIGMIIMAAVNTALNLLFTLVFRLGLFGMGLATSISYFVAAAALLHCFIGKKQLIVRLRFGVFRFREFLSAIKLGLPHLMFHLGIIIKASMFNYTLISLGSSQALAVMAVHNTVCGFIGMIPAAISSTALMLGGIFFGEENSASLKALLKYALRAGILLTVLTTVAVMLLSGPISSTYYRQGTELWDMTKQMLMIFPSFIIFNVIFYVCIRIHQTTEHILSSNILSIVENLLSGMFFWLLGTSLGIGPAWMSYTCAEITVLILLAVYVFIKSRRITFRAYDWLLLDEKRQFAPPDKRLDFTVTLETSPTSVIEFIDDFADRCIPDRTVHINLLLCAEEILTDISKMNHDVNNPLRINVHISSKDDVIKMLIRDNGIPDDPSKRVSIIDPNNMTRNVEVRIVAGTSKRMYYQCILGMNVLFVEI